jgi:hypothetical protein
LAPAPKRKLSLVRNLLGDMGGSENCGFTTFQQCMEDVSGIGGFCQQNNTYTPAGGAPSRHSKTRRY